MVFSGKVLKEKREEVGLRQSDMAAKLGISRAAYFKWENDQTRPNKKNTEQLARILNVDVEYFESEFQIATNYLSLNELNQQKALEFVTQLLEKQESVALSKKVIQLFPIQVLEDVPLSAGPGAGFYDEATYQTVYADQDYSYDFANFVEGDSMEPYYNNGEVVLVNESSFDYDGAVYAVYLNGRTYIKRVYKEKNRFRMVSYNKKYDDFYADAEDDFRIVGKIIGNFMPVEQGE